MRVARGRSPRAVKALIAAELASAVGTEMTWLAVPWLILTTTGSAAKMGLAMAAEVAPVGLTIIFGGRVTAALGARRTALACELGRAPIVLLIAALAATGALSLAPLLVLLALAGVMIAPHLAAQRLLLAELGGEEFDTVNRSSAGLQAATRGAMLVGPLLAGLLIPLIGTVAVIALDGITYLISFALIVAAVPVGVGAPRASADSSGPGAWHYIATDRLTRLLTAATTGAELSFQTLAASLPLLAFLYYSGSATTAGVLLACWGAGALASSLALTRINVDSSPLRFASIAAAGAAACMWVFALLPPLPVAAAFLAGVGLFTGLRAPPVLTTCILRTPAELRSQVTTIFVGVTLGSAPLALAVAGPALQWFGTRYVLFAAAAMASLCALAFATAARRDGSGRRRIRDRQQALRGPFGGRHPTWPRVDLGNSRMREEVKP